MIEPNSQPSIVEDSPTPFKIKVKLLSNETYDFQIQRTMLVRDFKELISPTVKVPVERMRIVFAGKQLLDDKPISEFVPETGMTVHLIARSAESQQPSQPPNQQPRQQPNSQPQSFPPPPPPQQNQNPFDGIMGMVNQMMGQIPLQNANGQGAQIPQVQMGFGNLGNFGAALGGLFNMPRPQQPQPPQQQPQQPQQQQQQQQSQHQPPQQQQQPAQEAERIPYDPISHLSQHITGLNLPLDNVTTDQEILNREGLTRYLRRLHHQSTRVLMQINRLVDLMEGGNYSHMNEFVPVLTSLNQANSVAIDCIRRLTQPNRPHSHPQQPPLPQPVRVNLPQQPSQQPPQQPPQQPQMPQMNNPFGMLQMMMPGLQQNSQGQQNSQRPQQGGQPNPLMGLDIGSLMGSLGGMGGMGNILSMKLSQLMEEDENESMLVSLLCDITGNNILQAFISRNFSFLDEQHGAIRQKLKELIEKEGREKVSEEMVRTLGSVLVPAAESANEFQDYERVKKECRAHLTRRIDEWIELTLGNSDRYSDETLRIGKLAFCESVETMVRLSKRQQDEVGLRIVKMQAMASMEPFIPGLSGMLYGIIEQRDIVRIYNEYKEEQTRRAQMSQEEAQSEERLIELISEIGQRDAETLARTPHSEEYFKRS